MKLATFVLFTFFGIVSSKNASSYIVGGNDASVENYPYTARILNFGIPSCGGAVISARSVLTAAHCIFLNASPTISISVGADKRNDPQSVTHRVSRIIIHPEYVSVLGNDEILRGDLAIVRTVRSIQFGLRIQPIALRSANLRPGEIVLMTGFGFIGENERSNQMQKLELTVISNLECLLIHRDHRRRYWVTREVVCAVGAIGTGGCTADSGSPIIDPSTNQLVGITSWLVPPCTTFPTVYVRVAHHLEWIRENV